MKYLELNTLLNKQLIKKLFSIKIIHFCVIFNINYNKIDYKIIIQLTT